ncbi:MAG: MBL fold metallo-hydrolase [Pseudomonadota bacterium]
MRFVWLLLKGILAILLLVVVAGVLFYTLAPTFGGRPDAQSQARIAASANHDGEQFINLIPTQVSTPDPNNPFSIWEMFSSPEGKNPGEALPTRAFTGSELADGDMVWFGHSTVLLQLGQLTVITDPVFYNASPLPGTARPFAMQHPPSLSSLPPIDVALISHDHYDHLDIRAVKELRDTTTIFLVPLGVKAHLQRWGIPDPAIFEFDWYESHTVDDTEFVLTPSRHFSGRRFTRSQTLWGSWVIASPDSRIFFSGDSGYFDEFAKIGERYGPFDIAFLENGAYDTNWASIHMMPEEAVQAMEALKAELFFPIHWGKFDLARHPWKEPIERASRAAAARGAPIVTPMIGQRFRVDAHQSQSWWEAVE